MVVHFIFFTIVIKKRRYSQAELEQFARHQRLTEQLEIERAKHYLYR
ncbi:YrzI family small protein [Alkalicoccobacillus porphyridii]|uniref:YrzI family small protein n=1 Tax=Alkalicoccobacillus porphyridii TaxID=2597270 RepID=A0A553ZWG3_9BACI|nr:YrzI family small protein [Alkalicoccobacillus porphyridii]TSB45772.1 YrzI family small protein [Alkalicoccobacillus porphyridii]